MFGTQPRARRPLLLILVFGALLAIIGVTATAQSVMVSLHFSTSTLNTLVASNSATVRAVLNDKVKLHFFDPAVGPSDCRTNGPRGAARCPDPPHRDPPRRDPPPGRDDRCGESGRGRGDRDEPESRRRGCRVRPTECGDPAGRRCRRRTRRCSSRRRSFASSCRSPRPTARCMRSSESGGTQSPCSTLLDRVRRDVVAVTLTRGHHRGDHPLSHLPIGPGPADPADRRPGRVHPTRSTDRDAQPRGARVPPGRRDRAGPRGRRAARGRADRHRQLPVAQ